MAATSDKQLEHFPNLVTMFLNRAREKRDRPFLWKKVDGQWKVRVGKKVESTPPAEMELQIAMVELQAKVWSDVSADVTAGKLKAVADVKQTLEAKIRQANMEYLQARQKAATTAPATAPATP